MTGNISVLQSVPTLALHFNIVLLH